MSEDIAGRLRQLARDYADGRLGLLDYRKLRAPLLDFLVTERGDVEFDEAVTTRPQFAGTLSPAAAPAAAAAAPLPPSEVASRSSDTPAETKGGGTAALTDATQHRVGGSRFWMLAAVLLALLLIAVLGSRYHWMIR